MVKEALVNKEYLEIFVSTASIDGSHFAIAWVSEYVTPQQKAQVSYQIPQEARKTSIHCSESINSQLINFATF